MKHRRFFQIKDVLMKLGVMNKDGAMAQSFIQRFKKLKIKLHLRTCYKIQDVNKIHTEILSISVGTHYFSMKLLKKLSKFWDWKFNPKTKKIKMHRTPSHVQQWIETKKRLIQQSLENQSRNITPKDEILKLRSKYPALI